jgi:hypothetical protein|tara:strand:- start:8 stop:430 length:423 start_codon:yes stop_codon:yes gene_type:complete
MMLYKLGAFANEFAGAASIHPQVSIYPHNADTFGQEIGKVLIDLIALTSIAMLSVKQFKKTGSENDALATALGSLIVAFALPNLFLHRIIDKFFKKSGIFIKIAIALGIIAVLYNIEPFAVESIRHLLTFKQNEIYQKRA